MTQDQEMALEVVARAFGWDKRPLREMALIAWSAFHYYARRAHGEGPRKSEEG